MRCRGADNEFKNETYGQIALATAVAWGHMPVVQHLLQQGAGIDTQDDRDKRTPLMEAICLMYDSPTEDPAPGKAEKIADQIKTSKAVAELLLTKGAKLELQDEKGLSTLALAAQKGHSMCLEFLLAKGADIESRDVKKRTPLMQAVKYHCRGAVQILLRHGATLEARDAKGKTPLFYSFNNRAVRGTDNQETFDLLIRKGADAAAVDNEGHMALMRVNQWEETTSTRTKQWEDFNAIQVPEWDKGGNKAGGRLKGDKRLQRRGSSSL